MICNNQLTVRRFPTDIHKKLSMLQGRPMASTRKPCLVTYVDIYIDNQLFTLRGDTFLRLVDGLAIYKVQLFKLLSICKDEGIYTVTFKTRNREFLNGQPHCFVPSRYV